MFPANLLILMVLLLPQIPSGHQGGPPPPPLQPGLAQSIQNLLLTRLGLRTRPTPRPGAHVPQYLLDLYRFHSQQYHLVQDPRFSFPKRHVQGANTVRSFHHLGSVPWKRGRPLLQSLRMTPPRKLKVRPRHRNIASPGEILQPLRSSPTSRPAPV